MNSTSAASNIAIETRSIEDSISHAHDAADRATRLADYILTDLNGPSPETDCEGLRANGLVNSADHLAGRLESLCRDLERIRSRLVNNAPKSVGLAATEQMKAGYAGRLG